MEKKKKIVLFAIIISVIAIIILSVISFKQRKRQKEFKTADMNEDISGIELIEKKLYFQDYKIVKNCIQTYMNTLNTESTSYYGHDENGNFVKLVKEEDIKENILNLLSENYVAKNSITIKNIYDYIDTVKKNMIIIPVNIIPETENSDIKIYKVSVLSMEINNKSKFDYLYLIVNIDEKNSTFSIEPIKNKEALENMKIDYKIENIEKKENNIYSPVKSTEEEIAKDYFMNYKYILLSDTNLAYSLLDKEYKEKRFENIDEFNKYVKKNEKIFESMRIEKYAINYYKDYFQYACQDQFGNMYIFNERDTMDYSVLLDAYTIALDEFNEKYDETNEKGKCVLNIEKVRQALNSGDYKYVYSKLATSFKNNNYKTQEDFEKYIKQAIYSNIILEYGDFSNEGETYIYNLKVKDANNEESKVVNMQIIMQLKENRDFIMSFSIK